MDSADSLVFRPKKSSAVWLLICCSLFVAIGLLMAGENVWMGYLCAGFFGLGIPVSIAQLLPGGAYLRVSPEDMVFVSMYRKTRIPWHVVERFFVVVLEIGLTRRKMVGFNYVPSYDRSRFGRRLSSAMAPCESALPNTFGYKAEELADILNSCLQKFTERQREHMSGPEME